jgi:uncharacterized membrane-anchored protein YjiN (DUF445 family)
VHAFLERSVIEPLKQRPIAPMLASGLTLLTANDRHQQLLDRLVIGLARLLADNEELIRDRVREESPWWVPGFVDDKLHDKIVDGIARTLSSVSEDPAHPLRRQVDELLTTWIVQLRDSPEMMARAESIKYQVLDNPTSDRLTESLWRELKPPSAALRAASSAGCRRWQRRHWRTRRCWPRSTTGSSARCSGSSSSTGTKPGSSSPTP